VAFSGYAFNEALLSLSQKIVSDEEIDARRALRWMMGHQRISAATHFGLYSR
jgi:hypothetical protein